MKGPKRPKSKRVDDVRIEDQSGDLGVPPEVGVILRASGESEGLMQEGRTRTRHVKHGGFAS